MSSTKSIPGVTNEESRSHRGEIIATGNMMDEPSPETRPQADHAAVVQRLTHWNYRILRIYRTYRKRKTDLRKLDSI